jgi:outer membrane immunogenic protein
MRRWPIISSVAVGLLLGLSAAAVAAPKKRLPPPPPPPVYNWTGYYAGGNLGYSWGNSNATFSDPLLALLGLPGASASLHPDGPVGGVQIGYNWQANNTWVLGLEADIQASGERDSANVDSNVLVAGHYTINLAQTIESKLLWFGTVRGRIGVLATPTILLYATGGLAYGGTNLNDNAVFTGTFPGGFAFSSNATKVGYTVGGGIEGAVPNSANWTWKLEYLYVDLGSQSFTGSETVIGTNYSWNSNFTDNIVRAGFNYRFQ